MRRHVHPEVRAGLDRPAVDARLDLAVEVALPFVLPAPVLRDERDRAAGGRRRRVEPEELQGLQRVHRGRPRLPRLSPVYDAGKHAPPAQSPSASSSARSCAPSPRAPLGPARPPRRPATPSRGSRMTCHRMAGSPSSSQADHAHRRTVSLAAGDARHGPWAGMRPGTVPTHGSRTTTWSTAPRVAYGPAVGWAVVRRRPPPRGCPPHGPFVSSHRAEGPCRVQAAVPPAGLGRHHTTSRLLAGCAVRTSKTPGHWRASCRCRLPDAVPFVHTHERGGMPMAVLMIGEVPNLTEEIYAGMVGQLMPLMRAFNGFISHAGGPNPRRRLAWSRSGSPKRTARSGSTRTSSPTCHPTSSRTGGTTRSTPPSRSSCRIAGSVSGDGVASEEANCGTYGRGTSGCGRLQPACGSRVAGTRRRSRRR